jgi:hypothetical protein
MRISSYYSDAFNGQFALRLKDSARNFQLECDLFKWEQRDVGAESTRVRSKLLARTLLERRGEDVLFVDPEAQLQRRPDALLDERDFDVGIYYDSRTLEISGPIFLRNSPPTLQLLRDWQALNRAEPGATELETLSQVLSRPSSVVRIRRLPVTYAWVERLHRDVHPSASPVIVHFKTDGLLSSRIRIPR